MNRSLVYTDWNGRALEPGADVVYNLSGDVVQGQIVKAPGAADPKRRASVFHIELLHNAAGMREGHISKVWWPRSIMVIS
jgi:hypothetical protein